MNNEADIRQKMCNDFIAIQIDIKLMIKALRSNFLSKVVLALFIFELLAIICFFATQRITYSQAVLSLIFVSVLKVNLMIFANNYHLIKAKIIAAKESLFWAKYGKIVQTDMIKNSIAIEGNKIIFKNPVNLKNKMITLLVNKSVCNVRSLSEDETIFELNGTFVQKPDSSAEIDDLIEWSNTMALLFFLMYSEASNDLRIA